MTRRVTSPPRADKPWQRVVSAGGVLFDDAGRVLLLQRTDERTWCFPKGHIEPGESAQEAAAREVREECGLACTIGPKVAEIEYAYYSPAEDVNYDKRVIYFLAKPQGMDMALESRFSDARWVRAPKALEMLPYRNDRSVLRKALRVAGLSGRK